MTDQSKTRGWRYWTTLNLGIFLAGVTSIAVSMARVSDATETASVRASRKQVTLNALDYRQRIYSFLQKSLGTSRQIDKELREYVGELYFTGRELTLLENDFFSGVLIDLGRDVQPDSEFSVFYGLRVYKKRFQMPQVPLQDHYLTNNEIDRNVIFGRPTDAHLSAGIGLGHTYLLRLTHRTRIGDERLYVLRVLDYTPGVKVTFMWRQIEMLTAVAPIDAR